MERLNTLKGQVKQRLEQDESTRNSDVKLTNSVWWHFYHEFIFKNDNGDVCVRLLDIYHLPSMDEVRRIRAKIQNEEHLFLPSDPRVRKQRHVREEEYLKFLGYL